MICTIGHVHREVCVFEISKKSKKSFSEDNFCSVHRIYFTLGKILYIALHYDRGTGIVILNQIEVTIAKNCFKTLNRLKM